MIQYIEGVYSRFCESISKKIRQVELVSVSRIVLRSMSCARSIVLRVFLTVDITWLFLVI